MADKKPTFKLIVRPHSHLKPVLSSTEKTIERATQSFKNWYAAYGVNCDNMKTFIVAPVDENGNIDLDNGNGWDTIISHDGEKTTFYPIK